MIIPIQMTPPEETALPPLREVGNNAKTQFWDMEDVMQALRVANRRGIPLQQLCAQPGPDPSLRQAS